MPKIPDPPKTGRAKPTPTPEKGRLHPLAIGDPIPHPDEETQEEYEARRRKEGRIMD